MELNLENMFVQNAGREEATNQLCLMMHDIDRKI